MVHASVRGGWSRSRAVSLVAGVILLTGLFGVLHLSEAAPPRKVPAKKKPAKGKTKAPPRPALKMTIVSKGSDVGEMVKVINTKLEASWATNKITPAAYIDDYEFLRRASLDIIGRIATPAEIAVFRRDPADKRRSLLIERLLKHEDYARHWANLWSNWLLTRAGVFGRGTYHDQMTDWLGDQFSQNKPYTEIVTKLITAKGKNTENGAVNFILAHVGERTPRKRAKEDGQFEMVPITSRITRLFLGIQVQCAQCHPHPFQDNIKQEQFWGINAFLRQVRRDGTPPTNRRRMARPVPLGLLDDDTVNTDPIVSFEQRNGKVVEVRAEFLPREGKTEGPKMNAKLKGLARREELARYLIDHDNFPKAIVNRMWGIFFGRGFVNPVDDFNDKNEPAHPELLNELARRFKHYNYDLKKLIRWITHSNAYHLSYVANKTNDKVEHETQFSRMILKAMSPEQLFESLMVATRAAQSESKAEKSKLRDKWLGALITNFGDDEGNEVTFNGTIVQALMMMNGKDINDAIARKNKGTVALAMKRRKASQVIDYLYLAALNRYPRRTERAEVMKNIPLLKASERARDSARWAYEDLFWALLNSNEFILNH